MATTTTESSTTTLPDPDIVEVSVEGGEVVGGSVSVQRDLGSTVRIVTTDAADHVHIHGYDLFFDVEPDSPAEIEFIADVPGVFEVELEDSHLLLIELEVS